MTALFSYFFKVIVCSALFAGCYWMVLRNGRFYQWNRFYIIAAVIMSATIPLLEITLPTPHIIHETTGYVTHVIVDPVDVEATALQTDNFSFSCSWFCFVACMFIMTLFLIKEIASLCRILRLKHRSERIKTPETDLYCTNDDTAPFTFFRIIFWKKDIPLDTSEGRCILRHELAHVRLGHSWDKALMQLFCCLFWMNPFFMLLRRELELVHEFAADRESIAEGDTEELSSLILYTLYPIHYHDFTSRFFQSSIKRRIIMMSKDKKSTMGLLRKLSVVPVILITLYAFSVKSAVPLPGKAGNIATSQPFSESVWQNPWMPQNDMEELVFVIGYQDKKITPKEDVKVIRDSERKIATGAVSYSEVDQKPVLQGFDNDFRSYLAKNLFYPANAQSRGITGTVVVSFVVDKNGKVTDIKSPVKIDFLSEELERVVKSSPTWIPGKQRGKNVAVQCFSFVEFRLAGQESTGKVTSETSAKSDSPKNDTELVYTIVEDMPLFNGKPAEEGFRDYVHANAVYPVEAQKNGISGRVFIEFDIDSDGYLRNAEVARSIDPLLDAEALRVIQSSPQWTPGYQKGKAVAVKFTFPVVFKLNGMVLSGGVLTNIATVNEIPEEHMFTIVETMPLFNGKLAEEGFTDYVNEHIVYPVDAKKKGISGRIFVEFVIDTDGSLIDAKVVRSVDPQLAAEALRVVNTSPKWTPGKQKGKNVKVRYTFPVVFPYQN